MPSLQSRYHPRTAGVAPKDAGSGKSKPWESPGSGHTEVQRPELERAPRELALRELIGRPAPQLSEAMAARFMRLVVAPELYPANYFALIDLDQLGQCPPRHDRRLAEGDPHDTNSGRPKP